MVGSVGLNTTHLARLLCSCDERERRQYNTVRVQWAGGMLGTVPQKL